jgi:hypothetical protein
MSASSPVVLGRHPQNSYLAVFGKRGMFALANCSLTTLVRLALATQAGCLLYHLPATWMMGRCSGSRSASLRTSWVTGAVSPSPSKTYCNRYPMGLPCVQSKWQCVSLPVVSRRWSRKAAIAFGNHRALGAQHPVAVHFHAPHLELGWISHVYFQEKYYVRWDVGRRLYAFVVLRNHQTHPPETSVDQPPQQGGVGRALLRAHHLHRQYIPKALLAPLRTPKAPWS